MIGRIVHSHRVLAYGDYKQARAFISCSDGLYLGSCYREIIQNRVGFQAWSLRFATGFLLACELSDFSALRDHSVPRKIIPLPARPSRSVGLVRQHCRDE